MSTIPKQDVYDTKQDVYDTKQNRMYTIPRGVPNDRGSHWTAATSAMRPGIQSLAILLIADFDEPLTLAAFAV